MLNVKCKNTDCKLNERGYFDGNFCIASEISIDEDGECNTFYDNQILSQRKPPNEPPTP
jgi:hypothetical protein